VQAADLIAFEKRVAEAFEAKLIKGPIHLSGGNEAQLVELFDLFISRDDWVFSTYRNHLHALLHGVPEDWLWNEILEGRSMNISSPKHRFLTSAIVGGTLPIAVGVAASVKNQGRSVWCFVGDMAATTGAFHEARTYALGHDLPIRFIVEDNGLSCDSPTDECWGKHQSLEGDGSYRYRYERTWPHNGSGKWVAF
jgi:TPP-dependent pyruvate/acetoin dehydrogenase alpha subunit